MTDHTHATDIASLRVYEEVLNPDEANRGDPGLILADKLAARSMEAHCSLYSLCALKTNLCVPYNLILLTQTMLLFFLKPIL